jgi:hypothetical protein
MCWQLLVVSRRKGKSVIELQIGDSPFPSTKHALDAGHQAIRDGHTRYCPSPGLPSFRETVAAVYAKEFGVTIGPENVVVGPGAKVFEQFFCEAYLDPGDAVLASLRRLRLLRRTFNDAVAGSLPALCNSLTSSDQTSTTSNASLSTNQKHVPSS